MSLEEILLGQLGGYILAFARIGAIFVFMPGFGERPVPARFRLFMALAVALALYPATGIEPVTLDAPVAFLGLLALEVTIGLWIGLTARIVMSALQFAGYQIGYVAGLSNALAPTTGQFEGATMVAGALMMAATALIFATDLHHLIIRALLTSYEVFPVGRIMPGDLAAQTVAAVGASFYVGLALSVPFYVMGIVLNVGLGLANRMMPTLPVFFVAGPVLIASGLIVLLAAAPTMLDHHLQELAAWLETFRF
ncbi:flagellar biosynthesis protein [Oceanicola granulosus HTCC2516]|uniref:Flagellar biosynthetic protein FliR n=1 Tax=Oceanicola granulosus (strain ATCC BAA-861 / DSM 15982 / KCTC 12143 / HTCC2516) TaxID=314256 RepID=Q2CGI6_OCEGH|nr:flagellar biosynthetic protein FliR [Oceanicola granulosus]EAR51732.1 flagellar biosynthesis protein [Oceanicola granulosus HTCC2516]